MESADLVTKAEDRGCEGVWEVCGDSFLVYCWMVWWVFSKRDVMWKGEGRIDNVFFRFNDGLYQDSGFSEREVG